MIHTDSYTDPYTGHNIERLQREEAERTPGAYVEAQINNALLKGAKQIRDNFFMIGATGFGKGLIAAAAVIVTAVSGYRGFAGVAGALTADGAAIPFIEAATQGLNIGLGMLTSYGGLAALALTGLAGASMSIMSQQDAIGAEQAIARQRVNSLAAQLKERTEELNACRTQTAGVTREPPAATAKAFAPQCLAETPDISYTQRELQRRQSAPQEKGI